MSSTHFSPALPGEYGYIIVEPNDNGETTVQRYPLLGYAIKITEGGPEDLKIQTLPVCTTGESFTPNFIQRHDGTFSRADGEYLCYSLSDMMNLFGFEADDPQWLPPTNVKELSEYVWRPLRNPQS